MISVTPMKLKLQINTNGPAPETNIKNQFFGRKGDHSNEWGKVVWNQEANIMVKVMVDKSEVVPEPQGTSTLERQVTPEAIFNGILAWESWGPGPNVQNLREAVLEPRVTLTLERQEAVYHGMLDWDAPYERYKVGFFTIRKVDDSEMIKTIKMRRVYYTMRYM